MNLRDQCRAVLSALLPQSCTYMATNDVTRKPRRFTSLDDLAYAAENWAAGSSDCYFKYSGYVNNPLDASAANVALTRVLVFDLDVHPSGYKDGKPCYPTKFDGHQALFSLLAEQSVPVPSVLVDSGGGLHYYWVLDRALPPREWLPYATRLKALLKFDRALSVDTTRVADPAGYLRLPYTHNSRSGTRAHPMGPTEGWSPWSGHEVKLADLDATLPAVDYTPMGDTSAASAAAYSRDLFNLGRLSDPDAFSQADISGMMTHCNLLRQVFDRKVHRHDAFLATMNTLMAATDLEQARLVAHAIFSRGEGYDAKEIDGMIDKRAARSQRGGNPSCAALRDNYDPTGAACVDCAVFKFSKGVQRVHHAAEMNRAHARKQQTAEETVPEPERVELPPEANPFVASTVRTVEDAMATVAQKFPVFTSGTGLPLPNNAMPAEGLGTFYDANLNTVHRGQRFDDKGDKVQYSAKLTNQFVWVGHRIHAWRSAGSESALRLYVARGTYSDYEVKSEDIDVTELIKADALATRLASMSIVIADPKHRKVMADHLSQSYNKANPIMATDTLGWAEDESYIDMAGLRLFSTGEMCAVEPSALSADTVSSAQLRGSLAGSLELLKAYASGGSDIAKMTICAAMGSLFMRFADQPSSFLHLHGRNGTGKSALMAAAMSFVGFNSPGNIASGSTTNAIPSALGSLSSVAGSIDELSTFNDDDLGALAMQVSGGEEKMRKNAGRSGLHDNRASWRTLLLGASNKPAAARIGGYGEIQTAQRARVFDLHVDQSTMQGDPALYALLKQLSAENTGYVGAIFASYVVQNRDAMKKWARATNLAMDAEFPAGEQRFMRVVSSCAVLASGLLNQLFPSEWTVTQKDMEEIVKHLMTAHTKLISSMEVDIFDLVATYLHEHMNQCHIVAMDQTSDEHHPYDMMPSELPMNSIRRVASNSASSSVRYRINEPRDPKTPNPIGQVVIPKKDFEHYVTSRTKIDYSSVMLRVEDPAARCTQQAYDMSCGLKVTGGNSIQGALGGQSFVDCLIFNWPYDKVDEIVKRAPPIIDNGSDAKIIDIGAKK